MKTKIEFGILIDTENCINGTLASEARVFETKINLMKNIIKLGILINT